MGLYQPTNVIPSTLSGAGIISASDPVKISWQVNGDVPMTHYQIDIYANTPNPFLIYSTGKSELTDPFYPRDARGNPQVFNFDLVNSWNTFSAATISVSSAVTYTATVNAATFGGKVGRQGQFEFIYNGSDWTLDGNTVTLSQYGIDLGDETKTNGDTLTVIYYAVENGGEYQLKITQFWGEGGESSVEQYSSSLFLARSTPTLTITPVIVSPDTTYGKADISLSATYSQAEGDAVKWVSWIISDDTTGKIVFSAEHINTSVLQCDFSGLLSGHTYTATCIVSTQNDASVTATVTFPVEYSATPSGNVFAACRIDGSTEMVWTVDDPDDLDSQVVYRSEISANGSSVVEKSKRIIANIGKTDTRMRDYGGVSRERYSYSVYGKSSNQYQTVSQTQNTICRILPFYTLIEAEQDIANPDVYHLVKLWRFGSNVEGGEISNNNTPTFFNNFTPYPYRQHSSLEAKSGTLSALLSNPRRGKYDNTAKEMRDLYKISTTQNTLFLKDKLGNLYMVATSSPITQGIDEVAGQAVTVSIPWQEVGSADDVSIISLPGDAGWISDEDYADIIYSSSFDFGSNVRSAYTSPSWKVNGQTDSIIIQVSGNFTELEAVVMAKTDPDAPFVPVSLIDLQQAKSSPYGIITKNGRYAPATDGVVEMRIVVSKVTGGYAKFYGWSANAIGYIAY